ncbi:unnamed protein product [Lactuca saligna]|uniref:Uncharacterized protein n=1 Tax=Lactuca saligna TaxID=75948 RepID=A0AA35V6Y9_LACSI|nr:unnamed protein product [Lactuca saligna]
MDDEESNSCKAQFQGYSLILFRSWKHHESASSQLRLKNNETWALNIFLLLCDETIIVNSLLQISIWTTAFQSESLFLPSLVGGSRVVTVDSEAEFNTLLCNIQDESIPTVFYFTVVWCGPLQPTLHFVLRKKEGVRNSWGRCEALKNHHGGFLQYV